VMRRKTVPQVVRSFRVRNTGYEQPWKRSAEEVCSETRCLSFVFIPLGAHQGAISFPLQVLIVLLTGRGSRYCVGHVDTALNYGKHIMEGKNNKSDKSLCTKKKSGAPRRGPSTRTAGADPSRVEMDRDRCICRRQVLVV